MPASLDTTYVFLNNFIVLCLMLLLAVQILEHLKANLSGLPCVPHPQI